MLKLFEFEPNSTGFDTFYIMSDTLENAIENLCKLENFTKEFYSKYQYMYTIKEYGVNEPTWSDNC